MSVLLAVKCESCGRTHHKNRSEYNRNVRLGRRFYCSRKCQGRGVLSNIPLDKRLNSKHLAKAGWQKSELSPFKQLLNSARYHCKGTDRECSVNLDDLKEQWDKQNGRCPITNWSLLIPEACGRKLPKSPNRASLDRIDNSKGYIVGNIRFIALMAQFAKHVWTDEEVTKFCHAAVHQHFPEILANVGNMTLKHWF